MLAWISAVLLVAVAVLVPKHHEGARSEPAAGGGVCRAPARATHVEADHGGADARDLAATLLLDGAARRWHVR